MSPPATRLDFTALDIFTPRGILPPWHPDGEVARARGYLRYELGDANSVFAADRRLGGESFPKQSRFRYWDEHARKIRESGKGYADWTRHVVKHSGGWVLPKYSVLTPVEADEAGYGKYDYPRPYAQLRPDNPVPGIPFGHHHDGMRHRKTNCPCGIGEHGGPNWRTRDNRPTWYQARYDPKAREKHEAGKLHLDQETGKAVVDPKTGGVIPTNQSHVHRPEAKYMLTPGASGKRLDRHPSTEFTTAEWVFFCLEGTLKNDALVSAGEAAFNVPSVTLWDIEEHVLDADFDDADEYPNVFEVILRELEIFAKLHLAGVPTIIVADSDWIHNENVRTQAFLCRGLLESLGVPCVAAAPPEGEYLWTRPDGRRMHRKVGVDDFLGPDPNYPHGGPLDLVLHEPALAPGFADFAEVYRKRPSRAGGRTANKPMVEKTLAFCRILSECATESSSEVVLDWDAWERRMAQIGHPVAARTLRRYADDLAALKWEGVPVLEITRAEKYRKIEQLGASEPAYATAKLHPAFHADPVKQKVGDWLDGKVARLPAQTPMDRAFATR